jgi:hypothetical protein
VLQYHFNWKVLSAIAGITWWNFYFQLYQSTIRAPQVVDFLAHLLRHLPGRLSGIAPRLIKATWSRKPAGPSARVTSASSAIMLDTRCDGCAACPCW